MVTLLNIGFLVAPPEVPLELVIVDISILCGCGIFPNAHRSLPRPNPRGADAPRSSQRNRRCRPRMGTRRLPRHPVHLRQRSPASHTRRNVLDRPRLQLRLPRPQHWHSAGRLPRRQHPANPRGAPPPPSPFALQVCCGLCRNSAGCKAWTHRDSTCWLKNDTAGRVAAADCVSGGAVHGGAARPWQAGCDLGARRAGGAGQSCLWWSQGCSIGCAKCATDLEPNGTIPPGPITGNPPHSARPPRGPAAAAAAA